MLTGDGRLASATWSGESQSGAEGWRDSGKPLLCSSHEKLQ